MRRVERAVRDHDIVAAIDIDAVAADIDEQAADLQIADAGGEDGDMRAAGEGEAAEGRDVAAFLSRAMILSALAAFRAGASGIRRG